MIQFQLTEEKQMDLEDIEDQYNVVSMMDLIEEKYTET